MQKTKINVIAETSLLAGLAMILDLLTQPMSLGPWISFSFKMVPIFILAFRRGIKPAMLAGLIWGILQVAFGEAAGNWLNLTQGFLEYFVAFSFVGIGGLVKPWLDKAMTKKETFKGLSLIILGIFLGTISRYFIHFIAGIIFWGSYAPKGQSALLYSSIINGSSWLGETLACSIALWLLYPFINIFLKK
ncbi:energy-coupled thiamine transporter ThiT [Streptococcus dentapri]|uniref:Energy-coupled thiamine transporter ThiT n=1 Tax=Streptococcus dentapri TaxID=573564 RepID=A0ABV8D1D9_9STRE